MDNDIELAVDSRPAPQDGGEHTVRDEGQAEPNEDSLNPVDGGWAAWKLILAAYVFEALLWGFPLSFGVFQNYYSQLPEFVNQRYISVIGTIASGMSYMGAPLIIPVLRRYAKYRRRMIWFGWTLCILGVLCGSFARTVGSLIFTQGVMYGIGFIIFYYPIISMVNEYWITRRGMAYGFLCSASGFSGIVMPLSLELLLNKYGYPTTLRVVAVGLVVLTGPLIPLLKGRLPPSAQNYTPRTSWAFLKTPLFWIYTASNLMQGLGYFFPSLYIPSYASTLGLSSRQGSLLLAIMCVSQVLGQFTFGYLSDRRLSVTVLSFASTLIPAAAVFALWGLARNFAMLSVFGLIYGFFGAGYTALWARMGMGVTTDVTSAFAVFGLFNFGKGIGNVLAGPISANMLFKHIHVGRYAVGKYEVLVLFTGSCMLASALSIAIGYLKIRKFWLLN
ncbi:uncharacterized protein Z520_10200 [Fonsecaea multimorphosa CBS 102226]|uniref:Major facilitator superfamily (MFS) profile domain-containing protein n=1 Tax=Fonsecaea multimorphosa CBS 102226 TaxID=1442371 RepID=A0A0D2JUI4_9EURO|nr:uncharacterized protein Z520_10200 [Fonsecaea multimorphosa CBS 102226]KIX94174.1 hypothetical protein Z520_10200 [Fonsecaea multimorphosa CBS 102226]OAL19527.1 hypothetical protein AYO22_09689 [Fonsecaea multimorphosa]